MAKKKLAHFAENLTFKHLFQFPRLDNLPGFPLKGNWHDDYFLNDHPITLELGCGKGEYTVNLAIMNRERNYIGIDIKGARLWKGCRMVKESGLGNVAFIRSRIEWIESFFSAGEVDEIWLTFPDPQPQSNRISKRLTSPEFLARYRNILKPGGIIHLKTDSEAFYRYTLGVVKKNNHVLLFSSDDIYRMEEPHEATGIRTFYEEIYRKEGIPIKYAEFKLSHES
ncbi:MAG: tRNA (guanosine(46)-N7)-methyltransferase TrmB [Bacteroidales bacterium]|nr:tRNA (guanosine(46)-N7)-methyltransferase TrmB [Bacteroidales bacterium]